MRRLYPIPFRLLDKGKQFKKWQWIRARTVKATRDHRPESHRLFVDTLECQEWVSSRNQWNERLAWLVKIPRWAGVDSHRLPSHGNHESLMLVHPERILALEIRSCARQDWTAEEKQKLLQEQAQFKLFSEIEGGQAPAILRKVPYDFYYRYHHRTAVGIAERVHKIVDWEVAALFWNCHRLHGKGWEAPFRRKFEEDLNNRQLMFLVGNLHRFQNQWLIVSLIYPPRPAKETANLWQ